MNCPRTKTYRLDDEDSLLLRLHERSDRVEVDTAVVGVHGFAVSVVAEEGVVASNEKLEELPEQLSTMLVADAKKTS